MPQIFKLSTHNGHSHVAFMDEYGRGVTSFDDGHSHELSINAETGEPWFSFVGEGKEAHSHVVVELKPQKEKKEDDSQVLYDVYSLAKEWMEADAENLLRAWEAEKFYWGEQWDGRIKKERESKKLSALTINLIAKQIEQLMGEQRAERTDMRCLPNDSGDQIKADIYNQVMKIILEKTFYGREESKVFENQVVPGRGCFNVWVDFAKNLEGDIKIESYPWDGISFGPHDKEDLADCEGLVKHRMYSKAKLKSMYPDYADRIEGSFVGSMISVSHPTANVGGTLDSTPLPVNDDYFKGERRYPVDLGGHPLVDIARKEMRVFECWRRLYKRVNVLAMPDYGFVQKLDGWTSTDAKKFKTIPGAYIVEREDTKMRITKVVGDVILSDENPADLPVADFFVVPAYGKKRGDRWVGKVYGSIDMQREVNYRHSQAIDIGNFQGGRGWLYDDTTFIDITDEDQFKDSIASPNYILKIADTMKPPLRQEGADFPSEIVNLMQMSEAALTNALNVETQSGGANESAGKFMERKKAKLLGSEYLFDNLAFAKKKLGYLLLKLIPKYYSPERIYRMLSNASQKMGPGEMMLGQEPFEQYAPEQIMAILQDEDVAEYDISISESAYSPTARIATSMMLADMARSGIPVPPELQFELSDLPDDIKRKIAQAFAQQAEAAQQQAAMTYKTEIHKSLIPQGIIPPSLQAELQAEAEQVAIAQQQQQGAPPVPNTNQLM